MQQMEQVPAAPYGAMIVAASPYVEQPHSSFHPLSMAGNGHHHHHQMITSPSSPVSSDGFGGGGGGGRKRGSDGVDRVMERRQRRMIKNRESAARSRARKQVKINPVYVYLHIFHTLSVTLSLKPKNASSPGVYRGAGD